MPNMRFRILLLSLPFLSVFTSSVIPAEEIVLIDATPRFLEKLVPQTAELGLDAQKGIRVETEKSGPWPGFRIEKQSWNLERCDQVVFHVTNLGKESITLNCRLDSPEVDFKTMTGTYTESFSVPAGKTIEGRIKLPSRIPEQLQEKLFGMRGYPGGARGQGNVGSAKPFRKDAVVGMTLFLNNPGKETRWSVQKVVAVSGGGAKRQEKWRNLPAEKFFPMIDRFGQFKHESWPGKVRSEDDLKKAIAAEKADLEKNPGPENRGKFGGNAAAAKREATGHFRAEKIDGTWWLIDPEGCPFWSHGTDCVGTGNGVTPISDREFYFEGLPDRKDDLFKNCYGKGWWAPHNYYENKVPFDTFNFTQSNLARKYGPDWRKIHAELVHKRLQSWGMNTIANWSDGFIYNLRHTPYTATFGTGNRKIEGSAGYWGKFPDPFSKEFEETVGKNAKAEAERSGDDPWCLGWFVDNEISWGGERSLALGAITSPADQPAKIVFLEDLKKKYDRIEKLNEAWGTKHADWNALAASKEKPDEKRAGSDLDDFHRKVCDQYFRTIRDAIRKHAPDKMYLGCRFAWGNETAIRVSAEYCDVMSFNKYNRSLAEFKLPGGIDKPVVIGEFHFGALDRGMFHTGLVPVDSQEDRAQAYETYVVSALRHPQIVGTHWFQYGDQATTGRGDGENYQIGLLTVCDTPYPETVKSVRKVGYRLYEIREKAAKKR